MKFLSGVLWGLFFLFPVCVLAQFQKIQSLGKDNSNRYSFALSREVILFQENNTAGTLYNGSVWSCDGTANGTKKIQDNIWIENESLQKGDTIFFVVTDPQSISYLMSYSTKGGLLKLTSLNMGHISNLIAVGGKLYFTIYDGTKSMIWESDGSVAGTATLPFDFNAQGYYGFNSLADLNGNLLVSVQSAIDTKRWLYDPVKNDTSFVKDNFKIPSDQVTLNGITYYANTDSLHGTELWRSDGKNAGTYLLAEIDPSSYYDSYLKKTIYRSSYPHHFFSFNGLIYFLVSRDIPGVPGLIDTVEELWVSDGTNGGVSPVLSYLNKWGRFDHFTFFSNYFLFTYNDEVHGNEWWISDGKASGTKLLIDLFQGPADAFSYSDSFFNIANQIFFSANNGKTGNELWMFDGTSKSVQQLYDVLQGPNSSRPHAIRKLNNRLIFEATDETSQINLYSLDLASSLPTAPNLTPLLPATQWFQTIGYEITISGFPVSTYYNYDLGIDSKNSIYLSGQFNSDKTIFYENSTVVQLPSYVKNATQVSKFGTDGVLQWQKVLHTDNGFTEFYNGPMLSTMPDNGVVVSRSFVSWIGGPWTNYLGLPALAYSGIYVTRLDTHGNILWAKYLLDSSYEPYVHEVKTDADGNIYMAGLYFNGLYWQDNLLLTYKYSPTYFLLKLSPTGDVVWARNVVTSWSDYGRIADLKIDERKNRLYLLITEGTRNETSSCEYQKWHFDLFSVGLDGNLIRTKEVESSDFMVASSFDYNSLHDFYVVGTFRGKLSSDGNSVSTPHEGDCSVTRGFVVQLDSAWKAISMKSGENDFSDPYEIKILPSDNYVLSGTNGKEIFIHQYDPLNNLLGKKSFYKDLDISGYPFVGTDFTYFNPILRFDQLGNFILTDRYVNSVDSVANSISGQTLKTFILKAPFNEIKPVEVTKDDQYPIYFYPNPAKDRLNIKIKEQANFNFNVQVVDAIGRLVDVPSLNWQNQIYYVDVAPYPNGLYFFIFDNGKQRITKKIVIAH